MPWPWGEPLSPSPATGNTYVSDSTRPEMSLVSIKKRHRQAHEAMRGVTWAAPPPPCDVCWLIDRLEQSIPIRSRGKRMYLLPPEAPHL